MRQFIITSPGYTGQAEVTYNEAGLLVVIDFTQTNLSSPVSIATFKNKIPADLNELEAAFTGTKATVIETSYEVTFEMFWEKFNLKRNKQNAIDVWKKMKKEEHVKALVSITAYDRYCNRNTWYNRMYPDTYLRKKHYNDEWDKI